MRWLFECRLVEYGDAWVSPGGLLLGAWLGRGLLRLGVR